MSMKQKSIRKIFYLATALLLLSIFWSVLTHFFTIISENYLFITLTTFSSWILVAAKLRRNEITASRTHELLFFLFCFPLIAFSSLALLKFTGHTMKVQPFSFTSGSLLIACLTWLLLRLNENLEYSFGRKIRVHSKLEDRDFHTIKNSLRFTRLEKYIEISKVTSPEAIKDIDLFIVSNKTQVDEEIMAAHLNGVRIESFDQFLTSLHGRVNPQQNFSSDFFTMKQFSTFITFYQSLKSMIGPVVAVMMLVLLMPVMILIGAVIKATSKGPAVFAQTRTGQNGKTFTLYKFRTMKIDAEKDGPKWWTPEDERVTLFGKFLRAAHLDELPQLINVIRGEMCFVGPRPELPAFYESLKKDIPHFHLRTLMKPGITGWAQIRGGYANSVDSSKIKLELDLYYMLNMNPLLDMQIVLDTLTGNKTIIENETIAEGLVYETVKHDNH